MEALRRFWQFVSIDAPWAVSNWLWAQILNPLLASLRRLTLRRLVHVAAFLIIAYAAAQLFPPDLAVMFAGDTALYAEIASFAYLAIARGRVHRAIVPAVQILRAALRRTIMRGVARTRRLPRHPRLFDSKDSDDVPDGAFVFA